MTKITFILRQFLTWQAILDIALITAGLFFLYRTLVRLGTWKILVGILVAFLIFTLANILNLEGIEWIFQNLSHVAVIALIVIFQPELRKLLEKVVSLQKKKPSSSDDEVLQTVALSLWQLAEQKRGAIIVYPGKEPIQERLSGGHRLAADASLPLIMSIFDPNSPGHDGAMIIEDNRLTNFGVRLPMSQTSRLPEDYGTRHHAAMGLAEQTDALVLVVSEERGVVSSFRNGTMKKLGSVDEIASAIKTHNTQENFLDIERFGRLNRRTFIPLIVSLVIAAVFWTTLTTINRQVVTKSLTLPLEYSSPGQGLLLIGEKAEEVRVQLAGPKSEIDSFVMSQPTVKIDLSSMVEGKQTILLTGENLGLPDRLSFVESNPSLIVLTLATMVKKSIPITPQLLGTLPDNRKLKGVKVIPNEIEVMMPPPKRGEKPLTVSTTPVYLNAVEGESRIFCKIIAPPTIQPVVRPWQDVEVVIEVTEAGK
ncbi:MAG: diadenylate cyclase [Pseudomonadota bacterium]